jgi:hypothetical protein
VDTRNFARLVVRPDLHHRIKILAAQRGQSVVDMTDELITPVLDRAEKELSRLKGDRPSHAGTID